MALCRHHINPSHPVHLTDSMDEEIADKVAAINMEQVEEPSKNALKKANKQKKLAEEKANKSATNTTKEAARSEAKKQSPKPQRRRLKALL